jgi:hypothetical protein
MKINREELYTHYMKWVDQVTEECDWKTSFGIEEILESIATILENNPHLYISNKEQIIDVAYENYNKEIIRQREIQKEEVNRLRSQGKRVRVILIELLSKEEFINKCKTDTEFSEKWGLKIEERELTFKERCDIQIKNLDGMYSSEKDIFIHSSIDAIKLIKMNENNIPTKLITIKYNDKTIESYE